MHCARCTCEEDTYLFKQNAVQFIIAGFQENLKHFTFCNICPQQTDLRSGAKLEGKDPREDQIFNWWDGE